MQLCFATKSQDLARAARDVFAGAWGSLVDRKGFHGGPRAVVRVESVGGALRGRLVKWPRTVGLLRTLRVLLGRGGTQEAAGGCEGVRLLECGRVQGALWKSERRHRRLAAV